VGFEPPRPAELADLEQRPQRVTRLPADVQQVKDYVAAHA
jgi:threonine synthase